MQCTPTDLRCMNRALELAERGRGGAEPNPLVGCVIAQGEQIIAEGFHARYGGAHAEIEALIAAGARAKGGTLYVTLEPCCHYGKTPPCTEAIIPAGIRRVVAALRDPFPKVNGGGLRQLASAGIETEVGLCEEAARRLNAPYLKLLATGRPWVHGKWAMTLDGKIATRSGYSQWISGPAARTIAHRLRARVDAILIGHRTADLDNPLLTARLESTAETGASSSTSANLPERVATRIVLDSLARLSANSQLVKTARQIPVLVACGPDAPGADIRRLTAAGCEVLPFAAATQFERTLQLLEELGSRKMTNVLVEGGSQVLGTLLDARQIDEVHVFLAPKLFGGAKAISPIAGAGIDQVAQAIALDELTSRMVDGDLYLHGRVRNHTL